jgi:hypothetical protein
VFSIRAQNDMTLELYSQLGQLLQTIELNANNKHSVSFSNLAEGVYYLKENGGREQSYSRIIVTH